MSKRAFAKHPRTDAPAIPYKRLLPGVQRRNHRRKLLSVAHRGGVVDAQARRADGQGALEQGAGTVKVALVAQDKGEAIETVGTGGVVGTQAGLVDG
jgi:hypothetical protein